MGWQKKVDRAVSKVTGSGSQGPGWSDAAREASAKARAAQIHQRESGWKTGLTDDQVAKKEGYDSHAHKTEVNSPEYKAKMKAWAKSHGGKDRYRQKSNAEW